MQSLLVVCHHLMSIYDPYNFQTCICPTRALFFVNIIKSVFLVHFRSERRLADSGAGQVLLLFTQGNFLIRKFLTPNPAKIS